MRTVSASRFQMRSPLERSMQKSAIMRFDLTLPSSSSVSHMPVTPRCIPPSDLNERPSPETMRRRGENEMRWEGKKAGGSVCSGSSGAVDDECELATGWLHAVKRSLSEKSTPCQGSECVTGRVGAETERGRVGALLGGGGGGRTVAKEGREADAGSADVDAAEDAARCAGGGRQNEPADDDGVMAHDVASLNGEFGSDGYGEADPQDEGDGGSPRSSRSAQGSRDRGRARAAAATSAMLKGLLPSTAGAGCATGAASRSVSREVEAIMLGRDDEGAS